MLLALLVHFYNYANNYASFCKLCHFSKIFRNYASTFYVKFGLQFLNNYVTKI